MYHLVSTLEKNTSLINCHGDKLLTLLFTTEETRVFFTFKDVSCLCGFVDQYIQLGEKTEENVKSSSVIQICFGSTICFCLYCMRLTPIQIVTVHF